MNWANLKKIIPCPMVDKWSKPVLESAEVGFFLSLFTTVFLPEKAHGPTKAILPFLFGPILIFLKSYCAPAP